jgi:hypothetical protein
MTALSEQKINANKHRRYLEVCLGEFGGVRLKPMATWRLNILKWCLNLNLSMECPSGGYNFKLFVNP